MGGGPDGIKSYLLSETDLAPLLQHTQGVAKASGQGASIRADATYTKTLGGAATHHETFSPAGVR